ncbi:Spc7 kinetochore protein-domain-containing protein [Cristinia sonorae]|uniref:Spc7 kinetochore protein-domain-containing protein n=1 Tax=Cristinia sonorae TaxID=1940300 RepID=A0A8K0UI39_9AGAR|nr:Spc7 kinetochore protein-domain-containing protein [Cristinia sonorae]
MSARISPHRRRSISVLNQGTSSRTAQQQRRRAYSIAPGEKLSPAARARRMVPRKSILKPPNPSPLSAEDDTTDTQETSGAMDSDNTTRSRRVSFAAKAFVRVFIKDNKNSHDNDVSSLSPSEQQPEQQSREETVNDDTSRSRRRSSRRRSSTTFHGEQSMDLDEDETAPYPSHFLGEANQFEEDDDLGLGDYDDEGNEDDMDLTEALDPRIARKRSLSLGGGQASRRRSSVGGVTTSSQSQSENQLPLNHHDDPEEDMDLTTSSANSQSFMSEGSSGEPMEFTIPMGQALDPATEDPVWQQLRAVTHAAGNEPSSDDSPHAEDDTGEPMELTMAMDRMLRARSSLGLPPLDEPLTTTQYEGDDVDNDNSFTSTEDGSFRELSDQTINVTLHRSSIGSQDMEVTDLLQSDIQIAPQAAPSTTLEPPRATQDTTSDPPRVFSAPPPRAAPPPEKPPTSVPEKPFTFTLPPKPAAPSALPVPARPPKIPVFKGTAAFAPPTVPKSPKKRPAPDNIFPSGDGDRPSPAKKQAVSRLSPARPASDTPSTATATGQSKRPGALRRPSGYFAQRKSLGASAAPQTQSASSGRISLGANVAGKAALYPDLGAFRKEASPSQPRGVDPGNADQRGEQEPARPLAAVSSPTRRSSSPQTVQSHGAGSNKNGASTTTSYPALERSVSPIERRGSMAEAIRSTPQFTSPPGKPIVSLETEIELPQKQQPQLDNSTPSVEHRDKIQDEPEPEDEMQPISLEQFFAMTEVTFMDEITAPRRSIHPSQLQQPSRRRRLSFQSDASPQSTTPSSLAQSTGLNFDADVPLAEFITALAVDLPQLELYSTVANQLTAWVEDSRKICRQADQEALEVPPGVFQDFMEANDEERKLLINQLRIIKANNHGTAKSQWYDWKKAWVEQLRATAEGVFANLEADGKLIENINAQAKDMLPALQEEFARVTQELQQEQEEIAEVEMDDQQYLAELKDTLKEQGSELESYRADVSEAKAKLARLEEKLAEIESQKAEASTAINQAEHIINIQKESTSAEVFKLQAELEALQDLHLWRCIRLTSDVVDFVYATRYQVKIPCSHFTPIPSRIEIHKTKRLNHRERDVFPQLSQLAIDGAISLVQRAGEGKVLKQIVQMLGDFWSSCAQLRSQLSFLNIKYPVSTMLKTPGSGSSDLIACATVLFRSVKSKAQILFVLDPDAYSSWPMSIRSLKTEVNVIYGRADQEVILNAVNGRLSQASPSDNHGCLLDACIEAAEQYA